MLTDKPTNDKLKQKHNLLAAGKMHC